MDSLKLATSSARGPLLILILCILLVALFPHPHRAAPTLPPGAQERVQQAAPVAIQEIMQ